MEFCFRTVATELLEGQILVACHCPVKPTEKSQTQGPVRGKLLGSYWVCAKSLGGSSNTTISCLHAHWMFTLKISDWGPKLASAI